jgi:L-malate glycosyltransferase
MNILLLTNCIAQPDDTDKSVNDIVFSFAKEWQAAGHRVVVINSESKFIYAFYKVPKFILKELKRRGNFTVPSIASRKKLEWEKNGVKILRLPMFKLYPHAAFSSKQYDKQKGQIIEYLDSLSFVPDVITGHWMEPQLKLVNSLGDYYGAKKALVIHGELPNKMSNEYQNLISELDILFFRSRFVRDKMAKIYGGKFLSTEKVKICYSGIPDEFVENQKKRNDWKKNGVIKFIYVGRLERYKRIDAILEGLVKAFPKNDFILEIVGDGPEKENLISKAIELNILNNVSFVGRIPRSDVIKRMNEADCFLMISENEVFGLVYLEAMACGCLTVAAFDGGVDGIIVSKVNGFLCSQGDSESLKKVLEQINNLENNEVEMIRNSAYATVKNYTDSQAAKDYLGQISNR